MATAARYLLVTLRLKYKGWYDAVSMAVYVLIVYGLGLWLGPLGRDHARLAEAAAPPDDAVALSVEDLFLRMQVSAFGDWAPGYHFVNLALLLGCMLLLYFLVCAIVRGPFWLGTLAAVLFMANPATGSGVLHITASDYLLPAFVGLAALLLWTFYRFRPRVWKACAAWIALIGAVTLFRSAAFVWAPALLIEFLVLPRERRSRTAVSGLVALGLLSAAHWLPAIIGDFHGVGDIVAPLYFLAYPLGFLPKTAKVFHDWPAVAWASGALGALALALVLRRANRRAITLGFASALILRLAATEQPIDLVHLSGMGQLLLPSALFHLGLVALFLRTMDHPRWQSAIVAGTTILCIVYFTVQVHHVLMWRHADGIVRDVRAQVEALLEDGDGPAAVCPDLRYMGGAPVCVSEALTHDTPFGEALPIAQLLPIHHQYGAGYALLSWDRLGGLLIAEGTAPIALAPWPYTLAQEGATVPINGGRATLESAGFPIRIRLTADDAWPESVIIPGS